MKQGNVSESSDDGSKTESISDSEEGAQTDPSNLPVRLLVELEPVVDNGGYIIHLPVGSEQIGGEYGERLGVEDIEAPVGNRHHHVDERHVADKDVDDGEERADQRATQERSHSGPVQREGSEPETGETRPDLVGRY